MRHKVIKNLGQLTKKEVKEVKTYLSLSKIEPNSFLTTFDSIKIKKTYTYLLPAVLDKIWHLFELNKIINERKILSVPLSSVAEILVLNRAISPNSDYQVANWYKKTYLS